MVDDDVLGLPGGVAGNRDNAGGLAADLRGAVHRRALQGGVVGQVVQSPRVAGHAHICHAVPPSESGGGPDAVSYPLRIAHSQARRASDYVPRDVTDIDPVDRSKHFHGTLNR